MVSNITYLVTQRIRISSSWWTKSMKSTFSSSVHNRRYLPIPIFNVAEITWRSICARSRNIKVWKCKIWPLSTCAKLSNKTWLKIRNVLISSHFSFNSATSIIGSWSWIARQHRFSKSRWGTHSWCFRISKERTHILSICTKRLCYWIKTWPWNIFLDFILHSILILSPRWHRILFSISCNSSHILVLTWTRNDSICLILVSFTYHFCKSISSSSKWAIQGFTQLRLYFDSCRRIYWVSSWVGRLAFFANCSKTSSDSKTCSSSILCWR